LILSTEVYYFSGTGNSLVVARDIAGKINGKLIAITSVMDKESVKSDADVVGIVFPVYYATNDCGIPLIVGRFVQKMETLGGKYIFAVCTCGHMPGTTIENLKKAIQFRGGELAAGFTISISKEGLTEETLRHIKLSLSKRFTASMNNERLTEEKQQKTSINQQKKFNAICEYVATRKTGKFETRSTLRKIVFAPLLHFLIKPAFSRRYRKLSNTSSHLPFSELMPIADRSFQIDEKCNGCEICAKVCPAKNIKMVDGRPVWQHHCENCLACYSWCPKEAIHGGILSTNKMPTRYHHPDVKISDMLIRDDT